MIDDFIEVFDITRSLYQAGCPYDNAVSESNYHSFKIEFIKQETFHTLEESILKPRNMFAGGTSTAPYSQQFLAIKHQ